MRSRNGSGWPATSGATVARRASMPLVRYRAGGLLLGVGETVPRRIARQDDAAAALTRRRGRCRPDGRQIRPAVAAVIGHRPLPRTGVVNGMAASRAAADGARAAPTSGGGRRSRAGRDAAGARVLLMGQLADGGCSAQRAKRAANSSRRRPKVSITGLLSRVGISAKNRRPRSPHACGGRRRRSEAIVVVEEGPTQRDAVGDAPAGLGLGSRNRPARAGMRR